MREATLQLLLHLNFIQTVLRLKLVIEYYTLLL